MQDTAWSKCYLSLDGVDANPNTLDTVIFPATESSWLIEMDITEAARNWKKEEPNYGVLIYATNDNDDGYDIRFRSREYSTDNPHLFVYCN